MKKIKSVGTLIEHISIFYMEFSFIAFPPSPLSVFQNFRRFRETENNKWAIHIRRKINIVHASFRHFHAPWRNTLPTTVLRATVEPLSRFVTDCHRFPPDDRPVIISDSRERLNELKRFFNSSSLPESVELGILPRYGTIGSAIKLSHARKFKS